MTMKIAAQSMYNRLRQLGMLLAGSGIEEPCPLGRFDHHGGRGRQKSLDTRGNFNYFPVADPNGHKGALRCRIGV